MSLCVLTNAFGSDFLLQSHKSPADAFPSSIFNFMALATEAIAGRGYAIDPTESAGLQRLIPRSGIPPSTPVRSPYAPIEIEIPTLDGIITVIISANNDSNEKNMAAALFVLTPKELASHKAYIKQHSLAQRSVYATISLKRIGPISGPTGDAHSHMAFNLDNTRMAAVIYTLLVEFDLTTRRLVSKRTVDPTHQIFDSRGYTGQIKNFFYDSHGELVWIANRPTIDRSAKVSPDGTKVVSFEKDGSILIHHTSLYHGHHEIVDAGGAAALPQVHDSPVRIFDSGRTIYNVCFSPDGKMLATISSNDTLKGPRPIRLWDTSTGLPMKIFREVALHIPWRNPGRSSSRADRIDEKAPQAGLLAMLPEGANMKAFSPDGHWLLLDTREPLGYALMKVDLTDVHSGELVYRISEGRDPQFSPDGTFLSVHKDHEGLSEIDVLNLETGEHYSYRINARSSFGRGIDDILGFSPDGGMVIVRNETISSTDIRIYKTETGRLLATVTEKEAIRGAQFSPDGKLFLTIGYQGQIMVHEVSYDANFPARVPNPHARTSRRSV